MGAAPNPRGIHRVRAYRGIGPPTRGGTQSPRVGLTAIPRPVAEPRDGDKLFAVSLLAEVAARADVPVEGVIRVFTRQPVSRRIDGASSKSSTRSTRSSCGPSSGSRAPARPTWCRSDPSSPRPTSRCRRRPRRGPGHRADCVGGCARNTRRRAHGRARAPAQRAAVEITPSATTSSAPASPRRRPRRPCRPHYDGLARCRPASRPA